MPPLKNNKHERFSQALFQGMTQHNAYIYAGYSATQASDTIDRHACDLANTDIIQGRYNELCEKAASDRIMSVIERKEKLSKIARGELTDFVEFGTDGSIVSLNIEKGNSAPLQEVNVSEHYGRDDQVTKHTKIKLLDPVRSMDVLNKMEDVYAPVKIEVGPTEKMLEVLAGLKGYSEEGTQQHDSDND